ncbi:MAG: LysR family transcriptional regulator [Cyanobacteria bacterium P01_G01_bin.67]
MGGIDPYKLKVSQLRILVAVADYQNFSEAALHLDISQSAVSHAIATLEEQLGVILFKRGRKGADLTNAGAQLVTPAREILNLLQKMVTEANRAKGLKGGNVRLVSFRSAATHILPTLIAQFRSQFPLITVSVTEVEEDLEIENLLRAGKADIGLIHLFNPAGLETWDIYHDKYVVLLPRSLNLSQTKFTWQQLGSYPLIISATGSCSTKIRKYLSGSGESVNIAYEMREDSTILSMAIQGLGAAIVPELAAQPIPSELKLYALPVPLERIIKAAVIKDALHTPAVFAFMNTLKNYRAIADFANHS